MSTCVPPLEPVLHSALAGRFSPVLFDAGFTVSAAQVDTLLAAARQSPSAGNSQPWMFIVGRRGDAVHQRIVSHLARSSGRWAPAAALMVVNLARVWVEDDADMEYSEFARYDLGQAVAHMTVQGLTIGLHAHQFRAFDRDGVAAEFAVPRRWEVTSMTAFGVAAHVAGEIAGAGTSRERVDLGALTWARVPAEGAGTAHRR